jgi:adenylate cyclase
MLRISVTNERQQKQLTHGAGPLEFGRMPKEGSERFVVEDGYVSRDQLRIEELALGQMRLHNLGNPVALPDGSTLAKGEARDVPLPLKLAIGYTTFEFAAESTFPLWEESLQTISRPFGSKAAASPRPSKLAALGAAPSAEKLAGWFETLISVQKAAAGSAAFYDETARAVVDLVGLDRGIVLLRQGDRWEVVACHSLDPDQGPKFSRTVLERVADQKRTFYQGPSGTERSASLVRVEAVVASPIVDSEDRAVGVVYGSRDLRSDAVGSGIQPLEAQVVQLLAGAVSAGLARLEQEAEAARTRVQFEQFFSPVLVRELERNPKLLDAHERQITVLFSDLRGFSRISERLGANESYRLTGDVMDRLTAQILDHEGVIVDYHGDGICAMWNAPVDIPDHARLACRAALAMQQEMPALNERWADRAGTPLRIGVGVHTGPAQVGNAGSSRRLKYGPRGHTVNLASRIEGATKHLGVPILISGATRHLVGDTFVTRRLCKVRVVGIATPVELCELKGTTADAKWVALRDQYEHALSLFESSQWEASTKVLETLLDKGEALPDQPAKLLAERLSAAEQSGDSFEPIFQLDSK